MWAGLTEIVQMAEGGDNRTWHEALHSLLESPDVDDDDAIEFIETNVPREGEILDYKSDLYISAQSGHHKRRRKARLIKLFSALSNVRIPARFRYVFIGFDNEGQFIGMQYQQQRQGEQLLDVDDAKVRNIFKGNVTPTPNFEVFELAHGDDRGGVVAIRQAEQVPLVVEKTLRKQGGGEFIAEGQAYTRDGSSTKRMESSDFRDLMRYREELINEKIRELSDEFAQVVGIPDEQLAEFELKVAPADDDSLPMGELVTPNPTYDTDEALNSAVKTWRSTESLDFDRRSLYRFFHEREELDLDSDDDKEDKKTEFLVRASLKNHFHGGYWICEYDHSVDDLLEMFIEEDIDGNSIRPLERVLLVMGKQSLLHQIERTDFGWEGSKAKTYAQSCHDVIHERVGLYAPKNIKLDSGSYPVYDLVYGNASVEPIELMDEAIMELLSSDESRMRDKFRALELIYLAREN